MMKKVLDKKKNLKLKAKESASKFKKELRNSMTTAIVAAFGFLIALTWRDFIIEWVEKISSATPLQNNLITAIIVTILCVFGILVFSKFNNDKK